MDDINCSNCMIMDFKESLCDNCEAMKRRGRAEELEKLIIDMPRWIPCAEALPEDFQRAIVCNKHGDMMIGTYTNWGWMFPCYFEKPVAWIPLPEPYAERREENG